MAEEVEANSPEKRFLEDASARHFSLETKATGGHMAEISRDSKAKVSIDRVLHNERYVKDCILFCSIFPADYKFTRDMLVSQWMAKGLIKLGEGEILEELYSHCFDALFNMDYIVPCGYDYQIYYRIYKVGHKMNVFLKNQRLEPEFQKDLDSNETDVSKVEHLSLAFKEFVHIDFGMLKQCSGLQMLMIHRCFGSNIKHLPSDLFSKMKNLKILNLSHTDIRVLPTSIVDLEELQCLDISKSSIWGLPSSIHCLCNLRTLKLDGCPDLEGLPKCTSELIKLEHLVIEVVKLESMPKGIGKLTKLRTLGAFFVYDEDGYRIGELKNMNKLKGSFEIRNLEYVMTKDEAAEACLCNKHDLKRINLRWSELEDEKNPNEEEILEALQPPFGIEDLSIMFYSGGVLPSWMSNPSFSEVVRLSLYWCRHWSSLPSLGELPSLKFLTIHENNEVIEINNFFCRKRTDQHHVAFPKLEKLSFIKMSKLEKWTGIENGDFPNLHTLVIKYCPRLVGLPLLSHLNSLLNMDIISCPELSCLPGGGLPSTLKYLRITDCPKLSQWFSDERREEWSGVAHVRAIIIDNKKVKRFPHVKWFLS